MGGGILGALRGAAQAVGRAARGAAQAVGRAARGAAQAVGRAARGAAQAVGRVSKTRATETRVTETRMTETRATKPRVAEPVPTGVPAPGMGAEEPVPTGVPAPGMGAEEQQGGKPVEWKDDPGVKAGLQEMYADTVDVWKGLPYDQREDIVIAHFGADTLEDAARIWGDVTGKKIEEYSRPEEPGDVKYSTARTLSNRARIRRWKAGQ